MKNKLVLCLALVLGIYSLSAQSYFGFDIGFNVPNAGAALPGFDEIKLAEGQTVPDTTALVASLNVGPAFHLRYGKWLNQNVALGLNVGYLPGLVKGDFEVYLGPGVIAINTVSGKMLNFSPTFTLSTDNSSSKALYTRSGVTFGFGFSTKVETEIAARQVSSVREFTGGPAIGFLGAFGGRTKLSDKFSLYAELELTSLMHKPKEQRITTTSPAGTQEVIFDIVKTMGPNSSPFEIRTVAVPYSSIALNVGVLLSIE